MGELTEDLKKFLADCEEAFVDRYSESDSAFTKHCENKSKGPPIEERWFVRPPRQQFEGRDRGRNRWREGDRADRSRHTHDSRAWGEDSRGDRRNEHRGWRQREHYSGDRNHPYSRSSNYHNRY